MHTTGSAILTIVDRARSFLDEPSVDAKILNDAIVRQHMAPAFVDVVSRINNTNAAQLVNRFTLTFQANVATYRLPPCVQEVLRFAVVDVDGMVQGDLYPRDRMDYRGSVWSLEGTAGCMVLRISQKPLNVETVEVWYVSNADSEPHYSAAGGSASSYQVAVTAATWDEASLTLTKVGGFANYTWQVGDKIRITGGTGATVGDYEIASRTDDDSIVLSSSIGSGADAQTDVAGRLFVWYANLDATPDLGRIDRRESSYIGQIYRLLGSERHWDTQITSYTYTGSVWKVGFRHPIDAGATPGALAYEVVPDGCSAAADAVACEVACRLGTGQKIAENHRVAILKHYRMAMKTLGDNLTNAQTVRGHHYDKSTPANPRVASWVYSWPS